MNTLFFIAILVIVVLAIRSEAASAVESVEQEDEKEDPVATIPHVVVPVWPPATTVGVVTRRCKISIGNTTPSFNTEIGMRPPIVGRPFCWHDRHK